MTAVGLHAGRWAGGAAGLVGSAIKSRGGGARAGCGCRRWGGAVGEQPQVFGAAAHEDGGGAGVRRITARAASTSQAVRQLDVSERYWISGTVKATLAASTH